MKYRNKKIVTTIAFTSCLIATNVFAAPFKPVTTVKDGRSDVTANPVVKVGKEYEIQGVKYNPADVEDYDIVGLASWYGEDFHGKLTANGEVFDMAEITAAHNTLPLPAIVEVTNLENGKKIIVRVNDRGPFSGGRVIDLSKRAAELLGFDKQGTAKVRVTLLKDITEQAMKEMPKAPVKSSAKDVAPVAEVVNNTSPQGVQLANAEDKNPNLGHSEAEMKAIALTEPSGVKSYMPRGVFVQIGAFSNNNEKVKKDVNSLSDIGVVSLQKVDIDGKNILRLRVGPYGSIDDALKIKNKLVKLGYADSRVVIEQ
jgi:rare lipoprotein A